MYYKLHILKVFYITFILLNCIQKIILILCFINHNILLILKHIFFYFIYKNILFNIFHR